MNNNQVLLLASSCSYISNKVRHLWVSKLVRKTTSLETILICYTKVRYKGSKFLLGFFCIHVCYYAQITNAAQGCQTQQTTTLFCLQIIKEMQRCTNILYTDQLKLDTSVVCFELFLGTRTVFWQSLKMSLKKIRSRSFMIFWVLTCCVVWRQMSWKEFLPRVSSLWEWNWVHSKSELKLLQSSWLI